MAGHSGDFGDSGDSGDAGNVALAGAGWLFADRVDLPFITEKYVAEQRTGRAYFGERNWAARWAAWRVVADFGQTGWHNLISLQGPGTFTSKTQNEEIKLLETMALDERPDALGEIIDQADEFIGYFMTIMGGKPATHPASYLVFNMANLVATLVAMHFKGVHDRPRPSHVSPALLPPLEVPGHASYPSGHATQAHLFARCAKDMLPVGQQTGMGMVLDALAARIARNREIAGLHYESDSKAGKYLADEIFKILSDETKMPHAPGQPSRFKAAMTSAIAEWA